MTLYRITYEAPSYYWVDKCVLAVGMFRLWLRTNEIFGNEKEAEAWIWKRDGDVLKNGTVVKADGVEWFNLYLHYLREERALSETQKGGE